MMCWLLMVRGATVVEIGGNLKVVGRVLLQGGYKVRTPKLPECTVVLTKSRLSL